MDADRFDTLLRAFATSPSRRGALRALVGTVLAGALGGRDTDALHAAKKKKGKGGGGGGNRRKGGGKDNKRKGKKKKDRGEECGSATCGRGSFCCDDARGICCAQGSECCNPAPGTGSCCAPPNRCAKTIGNDAGPWECCPPARQFTGFGVIRCCPGGTRSLGTHISSDDGPCCPEEKYCSNALTGGKCCADLVPICLNRATGRCCDEENRCGSSCCDPRFSTCCDGVTCCTNSPCYECVSGECRYKCEDFDWCDANGDCQNCDPETGCGG